MNPISFLSRNALINRPSGSANALAWSKRIFVIALLWFLCAVVIAQEHHGKGTAFSVQEIKPNLFLLQGRGGNIVVVKSPDGLVMVDSDYKDQTPELKKALNAIGGTLKYIINTHWHGDHTQGNIGLGKQAQNIIAHENVHQRLSEKQQVKLFNMVSEPYPLHARPTITYDKQMQLRVLNEHVRLLHAPNGHTDGDSIVFFEQANAVHMGDHFFNGFFPFVDVDSHGSVEGMIRNIDTVLTIIDNDTLIIPGHGPLGNKVGLNEFKNMLVGTQAEVKLQMDSGKNLSSIQSLGLSEQWKAWGKGFLPEKVWIQIVFNSLEAGRQDTL